MSKKKRFGISAALNRGLSETIHVVENNTSTFRNTVLPLSRIELDPENPRKLLINLNDVREGINSTDPDYVQKQAELEKLRELAHTIKSNGIINPIVVYKRGEYYRVVAGERRCLASILAGKQEIEARAFNDKPKNFDLKLIQWFENTSREDLSLAERLDNISEIIQEYVRQFPGIEVNATLLKNITGLSLSQCTYYFATLNGPHDVRKAIENGSVRNLDKAALLANIETDSLRAHAIDICASGASLKALRMLIHQHKMTSGLQKSLKPSSCGRKALKINMGSTLKVEVVKTIVDSVINQPSFHPYLNAFENINWNDFKQASKAFRRLIDILETEMAV